MQLKQHMTRIATGFILAVLAIVSIFFFPHNLFEALCAIIVSLASLEWTTLMGVTDWHKHGLYLLLVWLFMWLGQTYPLITAYVTIIWWLFALLVIIRPFGKKFIHHQLARIITGLFLLVPLWVSFVEIRSISRPLAFYIIMLVCFGDTAAYFVGSHFGKRQLAPTLSPKKSVEGLIGMLIVGTIAGMGVIVFTPGWRWYQYIIWFLMGIVLLLISVLGDLFESFVKRQLEVKDSGNLLPGHGGILDRMDSLAPSVPFYLVLATLFGLLH